MSAAAGRKRRAILFRGCLEGYEDYESSHNNYVEATSLLGPSEAAVRLPLLLHRQQNDKLRASTEKKVTTSTALTTSEKGRGGRLHCRRAGGRR